jgi:hypothetical protein
MLFVLLALHNATCFRPRYLIVSQGKLTSFSPQTGKFTIRYGGGQSEAVLLTLIMQPAFVPLPNCVPQGKLTSFLPQTGQICYDDGLLLTPHNATCFRPDCLCFAGQADLLFTANWQVHHPL